MPLTKITKPISLALVLLLPSLGRAEDIPKQLRKEIDAWATVFFQAGGAVGGREIPLPPKGFMKLMPANQIDVIERAGAIDKLRRATATEQNGLKKKEATEKAAQLKKELEEDLGKILAADGLKGWVFIYGIYNDSEQATRVVGSGSVTAEILFDKMGDEPKKAIRGLKPGDVIKVTTEGDPKAKPAFGHAPLVIRGDNVASIEKVK
jgi:hypothetical protein